MAVDALKTIDSLTVAAEQGTHNICDAESGTTRAVLDLRHRQTVLFLSRSGGRETAGKRELAVALTQRPLADGKRKCHYSKEQPRMTQVRRGCLTLRDAELPSATQPAGLS